ncbi:thrombopoietin isoform X2 [Haplochromis burtoni]|uniref:thrombopoietin isoform X2 n=1 Tax=Haplochromis burtoni TaxID=8153 RepID=UPI001C2D197C|nr:thrombopoietin isoform X2 [Haplochromis burtoni]
MALSRLLLLCMIASEVWDSETKSTEFVCSRAARKALNIVPKMSSALVQLPCTELHAASWEHKSEREKRGEIVASLRLLVEGVKSERSLRPAGCGALLLQRLENNINNYLLILTRLQLSGAVVTPSLSCVPRSTQSLRTVLMSYNLLISAKLEWFMVGLEHKCTNSR